MCVRLAVLGFNLSEVLSGGLLGVLDDKVLSVSLDLIITFTVLLGQLLYTEKQLMGSSLIL